MSSHPGLEFFNDCIICKTSSEDTSDITILFGILLTNDKGLILDVILLANLSPIETKIETKKASKYNDKKNQS